tara:strand:+ start:500 stop:1114 length:615 start_codon:yes stop_codon:yes gene_type:complete
MFTGLVEGVGLVSQITPEGSNGILEINSQNFNISDIKVGDSISVNGVCLTAINVGPCNLTFNISSETIKVTSGFELNQVVNLEKSMKISDRIGGHLVTGHVDAIGKVESLDSIGNNYEIEISCPFEIRKYLARKGSIAVNGVSLTVNNVVGEIFSVNIIPHTWETTNFKDIGIGRLVNLEIDLVARYVERMLSFGNEGNENKNC